MYFRLILTATLTELVKLQGKLENKPAAAATSRSTATFPCFVPSSLLVSILGTSLFFTSVFCFFLLLPLCG